MKITQNLERDEVKNCDAIEITLSNGDQIWVYDDNDGYGSVNIYRHDYGETSLVTSSTKRAVSVRRGERDCKRRLIELDRWNGGDTYFTSVEVRHFFNK